MASSPNPLLAPQREKAGSETAADYDYQYHWALRRAIQEQGQQNEYAVFVELHEDVVVSDSLNSSAAKFQFNQIKTTNKTFTSNVLLKKKSGKSVLGKLISSCMGKPFAMKVTELNFVAVSGFGIKLKKPKLSLSTITLPDIDDVELAAISLAIKNEINVDPLPKMLQFVIPELPDKNFQHYIIAEISTLISSLHPGTHCSPVDIYRILIDELNRKGQVTYDFSNWDDLIQNKALTSISVTKVLNEYTSLKDEAKVEAEFTAISTELGLNVMASKDLRNCFNRYRQTRIGNRTVSQLDITTGIKNLIASNLASANNDIGVLIDLVFSALEQKIKSNFASVRDVKAAIICEYIMEDS